MPARTRHALPRPARACFVAAAAILVSLLGATGASASAVGPVKLTACAGEGGSCSTVTAVRVDEAFGIEVEFKVTNQLGAGDTIYLELPSGGEFETPVATAVSYEGTEVLAPNAVADGGRQLQVTVPSALTDARGPITSASPLTLTVGFLAHQIIVPPAPGNFYVQASTSADTDLRSSEETIATTLGKPAALEGIGGPLRAIAGGGFEPPLVALLSDSRGNPIPGETIQFQLPLAGPGGGFEFEGQTAIDITDDAGQAVPHAPFTANAILGDWVVELIGPGSLTGTIAVTTVAVPVDRPTTRPPIAPPTPAPPAPPAVKISSGPRGATAAKRVRFSFGASGAAGFECRLDDRAWKLCSSPRSYPVAPGPHSFRVRALDAAGVPGPVAKRQFRRLAPRD